MSIICLGIISIMLSMWCINIQVGLFLVKLYDKK